MMLICLKTDEHFILNAVWQPCDFLAALKATVKIYAQNCLQAPAE